MVIRIVHNEPMKCVESSQQALNIAPVAGLSSSYHPLVKIQKVNRFVFVRSIPLPFAFYLVQALPGTK